MHTIYELIQIDYLNLKSQQALQKLLQKKIDKLLYYLNVVNVQYSDEVFFMHGHRLKRFKINRKVFISLVDDCSSCKELIQDQLVNIW